MLLNMIILQWRSKIWTSLDSEWSKRGWVANDLDLEIHQILKPNHLKYRQIATIISKTI